MSRLEGLIEELCPDGVESVPIGDVVSYEQPTKYIVKSTNYSDAFKTPVLTAGQSFILGYTDEKDGIYEASKDNPVIIFDDFTGAFKWVDFPFKVKSSAMKILHANENRVLPRYIFHVMCSLNFSSNEHKRLWIGMYSHFEISLPPLKVQREIVRILDNFTELTAELTAELAAELTARKQQYGYYRDEIYCRLNKYEKVPLGSVIISLNTGLNPRKFFRLNNENAKNYYVTVRELQNNQVIFSSKTDRIDDDALRLCNNRSNLEKGDILISGTGTIGEVAFVEKTPYNWNIKEGIYVIKPNPEKIDSKFLMYLLQTTTMQKILLSKAEGGTVKSVPMKEMKRLVIPLPPLEEQKKISSILDCLDLLCNDISSGLPAEIEARQKQYEYYRDKLLTFKEYTG